MSNLIKDIIGFSNKKKQSKIFLEFIEIFYLQNQQRDFKGYQVEELYKLALSAFEFAQNKKTEQKVRLINQEESGFEYNILEIINDDKPF
ncbi:MAG TPA: hypothetical protein VI861_03110, partial [Rickettsiales bacterium]|nr:hypothetical protein [Rickettsiales bacterium]